MDAETFFSTIGTISSVLAGATQTATIYSNKTSGTAFYLPINFLRVSHMCQLAWLVYGLMLQSLSLTIVNVLTVLLSLANLNLYQSISEKTSQVLVKYLVLLSSFSALMYFLHTVENIGLLAGFLSVFTFITTFEAMGLAIKNRQKAYIDAKITSVCLFNSIIWGMAGLAMSDNTVIYSNMFSASVCSLSLIIYSVLTLT